MEIYYEQNVVNNNIDERAKRTKTLILAKTICLVLGMFILVSSAMLITMFWVFILFALPFFVLFFIIGRVNKRYNTEYDYVIDNECIKISEIYFRQHRKLKHTIRLRLIESVGVFDSEGYKKIQQSANKKVLALVNYEDEDSIIYILYNTEKGKRIIFIEPDRGFMIALRRTLPALTIFDKSVSDFEARLNRIAEQEALQNSNDEELRDENENELNDSEEDTQADDNNAQQNDTLDQTDGDA